MSASDELRLLVIADDPLARAGLAALLDEQPGCQVVGRVASGGGWSADLDLYRPDVIVWDAGWAERRPAPMPADAPSWRNEGALREPGGEVNAPLLALLSDDSQARALWSAGARGLLPRDSRAEDLLAAVRALAQGLLVVHPRFAPALMPVREAEAEAPVESLTPREAQVLQLLADGLSNKAIAQALQISEHTVKFHINALLGKLDVQSRTEAVVRATRLGLIIL